MRMRRYTVAVGVIIVIVDALIVASTTTTGGLRSFAPALPRLAPIWLLFILQLTNSGDGADFCIRK